ncbi:hypothetical protein FEF26_09955 [Nesterenkonia salmonea]|uniref:Uncharacterized protein n=1 Tax=Nesterenkonia salmonea TaxID=1804987 RepID=A0A5R9B9L8_9MICC|nr:hypothetical protein [Nesterenkonia salmonea]TLP95834.1 hypothetical protein FEF26_09955 [Nesterenkonia salmonea]
MSTSFPTYRYSVIQRAALAVSEALASWAEAAARKRQFRIQSSEPDFCGQIRRQEAERRRDEALNQRFLMPRQF